MQSYLWALPAVNMIAMKKGLGDVAGYGYQMMSVYEKRLKPKTVITTPNSDVVYCLGFADLSETGPLVLEAPAKIQGLLDDFWHRPLLGPQINGVQYRGRGGTYLIVPEGEQVDLPDDFGKHFVFTCKTNGLIVRPLRGDAKPMEFRHVSDVPADALFPHDDSYFDLLDELIQSERIDTIDPYMHRMLAALGIAKGRDFAPSDHHRELLRSAAATAWKMAKNIAGRFGREEHALWWADRHWVAHARTELDDFLHTLLDEEYRDRGTGHTDVNAKAHMYVNHYSISTGMISSIVGMGARYAAAYQDSDGEQLRGEHTYRLDLPVDPPANILWSVTVYDAETASGVDADGQEYPSLNSMNDLAFNDDGSVTFHVGPQRPDGAQNWLKTVPGRGWFSIIRWYGPTQEFFDRKYKPGDFVRM